MALDLSEFGSYLSQQRELRGMSREHVASVTKIPEALIAALETGHLERLPERVWIQNFVRSYAQAIGLEPQEALLRFDELEHSGSHISLPPHVLEKLRRKKALIQMAIFTVVVLVVVTLGAIWLKQP